MSNSKIKIAFILPSLVAGGAERVMSLIAKNLNKSLFNVTLIVIGFEKDKAYDVDGINVVYFNKKRVLTGIPKLFFYTLKHKPSIVLSCMSHVNNIVALVLIFFPKTKLVTREANIKKVTELYHLQKTTLFDSVLKKITNKRTKAIICQSKDMAYELIHDFNIKPSKIQVINNPISDEFSYSNIQPKNEVTQYITVGRLHEEKGHIRILDILSKLNFTFHYTIIGTGDWLNEIINHAKKKNLYDKITFINYTNEIPQYLKQSDVFLQGSFAEGFPNALLESCAVGTPVIAFNAPGGTQEIIEHGINGFLADDENDFLKLLTIIKENNLDRLTVSKSVFNKFSKEKIVLEYEMLLNKIST